MFGNWNISWKINKSIVFLFVIIKTLIGSGIVLYYNSTIPNLIYEIRNMTVNKTYKK